MAKEEKRQKPKRMGMGRWMFNRATMPIRLGVFLIIVRGICFLLLGFIIFFLLSGGINQVKTGQSMANYFLMWGHRAADFMDSLAHGTNDTFVVTEDGIYFKDSVGDVPEDSALDSIDDDIPDEIGEWNENFGVGDVLTGNADGNGEEDTPEEESAGTQQGGGE